MWIQKIYSEVSGCFSLGLLKAHINLLHLPLLNCELLQGHALFIIVLPVINSVSITVTVQLNISK